MDNRLQLIVNMVEDGVGCVDVGTDHGFVPIELYKQGYKGNIIATDINAGPLKTAIKNADKSNIDSIEFYQTDGLDGIDSKSIDTVIVAGMGGDLICDIIDKAEWTMSNNYHLILQPMTKSEVLRYWLINNGYVIQNEKHFDIYSVISARYFDQNTCYTDYELYVGKNPSKEVLLKQLNYLSKKRNSVFFNEIYEDMLNEYNKRYL